STALYTLSLHDALPICRVRRVGDARLRDGRAPAEHLRAARRADAHRALGGDAARERERAARALYLARAADRGDGGRGGDLRDGRSEEHTSELQSRENLV